jgi:hypothetical protein
MIKLRSRWMRLVDPALPRRPGGGRVTVSVTRDHVLLCVVLIPVGRVVIPLRQPGRGNPDFGRKMPEGRD